MKPGLWFIPIFLIIGVIYQNCAGTPQNSQPLVSEEPQRHYYLLDSGYQCLTQNGSQIPSYKDHIISNSTQIIVIGDKCNDAPQVFPKEDAKFSFAGDESTLDYQGNTYQYMETPPF